MRELTRRCDFRAFVGWQYLAFVIIGVAFSAPMSYGKPFFFAMLHRKFPLEPQRPSFVKNVFVVDEATQINRKLSFSEALYSWIVTAPQRPSNDLFFVRKDHCGIVRFLSRNQNFGQIHGESRVCLVPRLFCFSYPTPVEVSAQEGSRAPVIYDLTPYQNHVGALGEAQIQSSSSMRSFGLSF
jgi:hypothetical protein